MNLNFLYFLTFISASSASSSATIYCNFERISSYYSCNPLKVEGNIEDSEELLLNGTHITDFKDDDVNYIRFNSPLTLDHVPTNIFNIFLNIEIFGLHSINLTTILSNSFYNCYKLKSLHMDGNKNLEDLPEGFAEECSNLKNIYMNGNGLKIIDENSFRGLYNLNYLMLSKNQIQTLPASIFIHTPNLEFLFLDHNQIKIFHPNIFYSTRKLQTLSVTHNFISTISSDLFRNNPLLDHMFFDKNEINEIEPKFFGEFPGRRDFYEYRFYKNNCTNSALISSHFKEENKIYKEENFKLCFDLWYEMHHEDLPNEINQIVETIYNEDFSSHHELFCRYFLNENRKYSCVLENVDFVLESIGGDHYENFADENVTQVFFFNSTLSKIPQKIFNKFPNLELLSVANTQLTIIDDYTFGECGKVKKIDASNNNISKIIESSLKNCKDLETLDVSGNPIEVIDGEIFHYDKHLKQIILRKNY